MITANKGEWSELYVLFKLLGEGKIHAGDGNLNKLDIVYPVLKIIRDELERSLEYTLVKDIVVVSENGKECIKINTDEFLYNSSVLFHNMKDGGNGKGAFSIPLIDDFLRKIHCEKVKAKPLDKSDIHIIIHDYRTGAEPNLGFSIKSEAGASPTLLNASGATLLQYEVENISPNEIDLINSIEGRRKIQERVHGIVKAGGRLKFSSITNSIFDNNLRMTDTCLPEIIGWLLADCYDKKDMNIKNAVKRIEKSNPLNFNLKYGHDLYGYKIKSLLVNIALGMIPARIWNGQYEATGGYIIVKDDGDVICFHIYDRNLLENYLFNNTKFETPSNSRYPMGCIYEENGKLYFNLVLQIRFIR